MLLSRKLRFNLSFNIFNTLRNIKEAVVAPKKHLKSLIEPSGIQNSTTTNLTAEGFDQVSSEWQTHFGGNPFDLQTYNYLEGVQLTNFGTVDNPTVIFTADAPFRFLGCSGPTNEDDYESHQLLWMMLRQGPLQRCQGCGQVFKLVRLRNQFSAQMDYYSNSFNIMPWQDLQESDYFNTISLQKANTHYEATHFETPQNNFYSLINPDEHDRLLTDPAYRMQRTAEGQLKAKVYLMAMNDYENERLAKSPWRQPISKLQYQNLINTQVILKKLDRQFRKLTKFHSRKYMDFANHQRRQKRMLERANKRWDNSYTIFTNDLTQQQQRYRDYFQTDLQNYRQDQRVQEFLDRQQLLAQDRYNLNKFDFQQTYASNPQDDQSSYVQRKIFKFKYRRALDSQQDYERRNTRMIAGQQARFKQHKHMETIQGYLKNPTANEGAYLQLLQNQSIAQYKDYFQTQNDQFDNVVLGLNKKKLSLAFQNWQIPLRDRSTYQTFPLPQWNKDLGFWANALQLATQVQKVGGKVSQLQANHSSATLSTSAVQQKN